MPRVPFFCDPGRMQPTGTGRTGGQRQLPTALLLLSVAVAAIAAGEIALLAAYGNGAPFELLVLVTLVGCVYTAAGILAWIRRPANGMGPLLCIGGLVWRTRPCSARDSVSCCRNRGWTLSALWRTRSHSWPWPRSRNRTWFSPTSGCHPRVPTTACGPRCVSEPFDRARRSWCCRSSSSAATPSSCSPTTPPASATCSSSAFSTSRPSAASCGGSARGEPPWTRRWWR